MQDLNKNIKAKLKTSRLSIFGYYSLLLFTGFGVVYVQREVLVLYILTIVILMVLIFREYHTYKILEDMLKK